MKILIFGGGSDIAKKVLAMETDSILIDHNACDIRNSESVDNFIRDHKPEVVINCAGILKPGSVKEQSLTDWEDQIRTNLIGSFNVAQASVKNGVKTIILIGSIAGLYGKAGYSAYSASKAGVVSLVQSLGMEGINAYCISPGGVDTKMRERDFPGEDVKNRLSTKDVVDIMFACINGKYKPGDNIVIRKRGFRKISIVDRGQPWKEYLKIQPYGTPKTI